MARRRGAGPSSGDTTEIYNALVGGHTMPHSAQPQHTNYWAPRTRKRHQQEHRPQRPTESSDPTQHAKGRTGDRPGPRKGATTRRNVTQGGGGETAVSLLFLVGVPVAGHLRVAPSCDSKMPLVFGPQRSPFSPGALCWSPPVRTRDRRFTTLSRAPNGTSNEHSCSDRIF